MGVLVVGTGNPRPNVLDGNLFAAPDHQRIARQARTIHTYTYR